MRRGVISAAIALALIAGPLVPSATAVQPRIAGGGGVSITDAPWQALVAVRNSEVCSGTIVSATWILTAAHCLDGGTSPGDVEVHVGVTRLSERSAESRATVAGIVLHPEWNPTTQWQDIALIKLGAPLAASASVQAAALPTADDAAAWPPAGASATVVGWGAASDGGVISDQLQRATVSVLGSPADPACGSYGGNFSAVAQVCAGVAGGGIDTCQGDSGGGLIVNGAAGPTVAGVVSTGFGCAQPAYPGVYARVPTSLPWITSQVGSAGLAPGSPGAIRVAPAGNGGLNVRWKAPDRDGGSPVTRYVVTTSPGRATCSTERTSCTLTKVKRGSKVTITVTPVNGAGPGAARSVTVRVR